MFSKAVLSPSFRLAGVLLLTTTSIKTNFLHNFDYPEARCRVKGEYENKIRRSAPPEKVFEVFASEKEGNELVMSHYDLFRALCPYNYTAKTNEELNEIFKDFKSKALAEFADLDGDGHISVYEFYYVSMLLQITPREELNFFQKRDLKLDKKGFKKLILYHNKKYSLTSSGILPDPRRMRVTDEKQELFLNKMAQKFFGPKETITFEDYRLLKSLLKKELYEFQFTQLASDPENGLSGEEFCKSIVSYLRPEVVPKYLKHIENMELNATITLEDYINFHSGIVNQFEDIADKLSQKGVLTYKRFLSFFDTYSRITSTTIPLQAISILFKVLDIDSKAQTNESESLINIWGWLDLDLNENRKWKIGGK